MEHGGERRPSGPATPPELEARLREALAADASIRWAYLFGSSARGEEFRDVDVAVMLDPAARGALPIGRIANTIEKISGGRPVDVVDLASAAPAVAGRILREGRLLVDREPEVRKGWEVDTNLQALDIEPWLREFERLRNQALRERAR